MSLQSIGSPHQVCQLPRQSRAGCGQPRVDGRPRHAEYPSNLLIGHFVVIEQQQRLAEIEDDTLPKPVEVLTSMTSCGSLVRLPSTHARELAFVFSHTIHHNAIIGTIARALHVALPENFGTAPSTIAYRNSNGCAQ